MLESCNGMEFPVDWSLSKLRKENFIPASLFLFLRDSSCFQGFSEFPGRKCSINPQYPRNQIDFSMFRDVFEMCCYLYQGRISRISKRSKVLTKDY